MTVAERDATATRGSGKRGAIAAKLARSIAVSAIVLLACYTGVASAEVTITSPPWESRAVTNNPTPTFLGATSEWYDPGISAPVKLKIYAGPSAGGELVSEPPVEQEAFNTGWRALVKTGLAQGTYTAEAEQGETAKSNPVTFTVVTAPPLVTITYPQSGSSSGGPSQLISGSAATAPYDIQSVTIEVFAGSSIPSSPSGAVASIVTPSGGSFSEVFALPPGTYTARAIQRDEAGNTGTSEPVTFTLAGSGPRPSGLPVATFSWVPLAPVAGQPVALVSGSTDAISPITGFGWDLAGNAPFTPGGPVLNTTFATPGNHVVRLQVTDARGASSIATESIPVSAAVLRLMQPFPIVRIAGVESSTGVRLSSLNVQAPIGVRVSVTCKGRCKLGSQSAQARATARKRRGNTVVLSFPRFQRFLPAGVTLEIRVSAAGEIGKYTRFVIHGHSVPTRADACLAGLNPKPIACPG